MFSEQVQVVSKKVNVLQGLQNPDVESTYQHLDQQDQIALGYVISDSLNGLKRILCEIVENWNNRFVVNWFIINLLSCHKAFI